MPGNLNKINELIDSIRFHSEAYGIDRIIADEYNLSSPPEQLRSARQTYVDLKILMCRLEAAVWPRREDAVTNQKEEKEISNRSSCEVQAI